MTQDDSSLNKPTDFTDLFADLGEDTSLSWADEGVETTSDVPTRHVVCFRVGEDHFAIAGDMVREIIGQAESTALPGAPPYITGILIVRRQVVALLSLNRFLELKEECSAARILIVESAHFTVGLLVDEVIGLQDWPESSLDPQKLPENMHPQARRFARGVHTFGTAHYIFLNLEALLDAAAVH